MPSRLTLFNLIESFLALKSKDTKYQHRVATLIDSWPKQNFVNINLLNG